MKVVRASLVLGLMAGPLLGVLRAQTPQESLWETPFEDPDVTFYHDVAHGGLVFAAGYEVLDDENNIHGGFIAALDAKTGEVAWTKQGDAATGSTGGASSESILGPLVTSKSVVVAGGGRMVAGPDMEGAVRAYDQKTGTLLWSKQIPTADFTKVAVVGKIAYAATTLGTQTQDPSILLVAYDLFTGDVVWDETYGPGAEDPRCFDLVASGKVVVVVGQQNGIGPGNTDWLVRAHDAKTGEFLWDDVVDLEGNSDAAYTATAKGSKLFVGGAVTRDGGDRDAFIKAYALASGDSPWDHHPEVAGDEFMQDVVTSGGKVFGLYLVNVHSFSVRAHAAKTGVVAWDEPASGTTFFTTFAEAANGSRVIVANSTTEALDAKSGDSAWTAPFAGFSAAIQGKRVFVAGFDGVAAFPVK